METENCTACEGKGYYIGDKGYELLCECCQGTGKQDEEW